MSLPPFLSDILIPFLVVGLAEIGDKTQIAVFCLAAKTKHHFSLLLGAVLAFAITDGLAIVLGDLLTNVIPGQYLKWGAGFLFLLFGVLILLSHNSSEKKCELKNPFLSAFGLVLLAEMGDKTQIASGLFATQYDPLLVFIGVMGALTGLSIMAVYLGKFLMAKINKRTLSIVAGGLFILLGIASFL